MASRPTIRDKMKLEFLVNRCLNNGNGSIEGNNRCYCGLYVPELDGQPSEFPCVYFLGRSFNVLDKTLDARGFEKMHMTRKYGCECPGHEVERLGKFMEKENK